MFRRVAYVGLFSGTTLQNHVKPKFGNKPGIAQPDDAGRMHPSEVNAQTMLIGNINHFIRKDRCVVLACIGQDVAKTVDPESALTYFGVERFDLRYGGIGA